MQSFQSRSNLPYREGNWKGTVARSLSQRSEQKLLTITSFRITRGTILSRTESIHIRINVIDTTGKILQHVNRSTIRGFARKSNFVTIECRDLVNGLMEDLTDPVQQSRQKILYSQNTFSKTYWTIKQYLIDTIHSTNATKEKVNIRDTLSGKNRMKQKMIHGVTTKATATMTCTTAQPK